MSRRMYNRNYKAFEHGHLLYASGFYIVVIEKPDLTYGGQGTKHL